MFLQLEEGQRGDIFSRFRFIFSNFIARAVESTTMEKERVVDLLVNRIHTKSPSECTPHTQKKAQEYAK